VWLLIFFLTPIVEMYLLIEVGGYLGALPTIGLVMLTAVIGVALLRVQGLATLTRGFRRLDGGQLPATEVAEGLLLAVAGALLLTPGFVTDTVGFLLLVPVLRIRVAAALLRRMSIGSFTTGTWPPADGGPRRPEDRVIEGQFEHVDADSPDQPPRDPPL
jgi:UPF0716 protein FxsA